MILNLSNLVTGVISGIVSAGLVWVFLLLYKKVILIKIRELLYRGIDLEGEWNGDATSIKKNSTNGENTTEKIKHKEITLTIIQNAYQIQGDLIVKNIHDKPENDSYSYYKHTGFIKDNFIIITYLPKSKKCIGLGAMAFTIKDGGKQLDGNLIGTDISVMELKQFDGICLQRK
jgi:hypothetical protein